MNKTLRTLLFALMVPGIAVLAACDRDTDDDMAPAATDAAPAVETAPPVADVPPEGTDMDAMAFADMDMNQDGGISMDELTADQMLHQHFAVADADGDGMLSEAEVAKHRADMGM